MHTRYTYKLPWKQCDTTLTKTRYSEFKYRTSQTKRCANNTQLCTLHCSILHTCFCTFNRTNCIAAHWWKENLFRLYRDEYTRVNDNGAAIRHDATCRYSFIYLRSWISTVNLKAPYYSQISFQRQYSWRCTPVAKKERIVSSVCALTETHIRSIPGNIIIKELLVLPLRLIVFHLC